MEQHHGLGETPRCPHNACGMCRQSRNSKTENRVRERKTEEAAGVPNDLGRAPAM